MTWEEFLGKIKGDNELAHIIGRMLATICTHPNYVNMTLMEVFEQHRDSALEMLNEP